MNSTLTHSKFLHEVKIRSEGAFFRENPCFAQNGVKGPFFDPKWTLLNFPLTLFIRSFQSYTRWGALKLVLNEFLGFLGTFLLCRKWCKWVISGPKINIFDFFSYLFIRFLWNCTWWQALKSGLKSLFCKKENCYYN